LDKGTIRQEVLALRKKMPGTDVELFSKSICNSLISLDVFKNAKVVALYHPFRNEADITSLTAEYGKITVFPKVEKGTRKLAFFRVSSIKDLVKGTYGIMEPANHLERVEISEIDLFFVPGVAFSSECERIGYGGGYYDSTLPFISQSAVAIGIAFDCQIVPPGFSDSNDMAMDMVITESRFFYKSN